MSIFDKKNVSGNSVKKSFFAGKKKYGTKWQPVSSKPLDDEDKAAISKAVVVSSEYGLSCCFFMKNGDLYFQPMSRDSQATVGEELDVDSIRIVTLSKSGEKDIERIMEK